MVPLLRILLRSIIVMTGTPGCRLPLELAMAAGSAGMMMGLLLLLRVMVEGLMRRRGGGVVGRPGGRGGCSELLLIFRGSVVD